MYLFLSSKPDGTVFIEPMICDKVVPIVRRVNATLHNEFGDVCVPSWHTTDGETYTANWAYPPTIDPDHPELIENCTMIIKPVLNAEDFRKSAELE